MARTNEVLFAYVSRGSFQVLGLFNHTVFDWTVDDEMTPERARLWSIYNEFQAAQAAPGEIMIGGIRGKGITTAGTPIVVTWTAIRQTEIMRKLEPNLDDIDFVKNLPDYVPSSSCSIDRVDCAVGSVQRAPNRSEWAARRHVSGPNPVPVPVWSLEHEVRT